MLNLCWGRESTDKEGFLYERIAEAMKDRNSEKDRVILLVPDQYTLQAERNAIHALQAEGLIDLEILSQSRLADRILNETGGITRVHIDKQGRQMLLARILAEENPNLQIFHGMERFSSFVEMTNDLISEMKQYDTDLDRLSQVIRSLDEKSLLCRKLMDIHRIYQRYEEEIQGKYTDTEDFIKLLLEKIPRSLLVSRSLFFVYGFESFSPKIVKLLATLEGNSRGMHVILTGEGSDESRTIFALCERMKKKFGEEVGSARYSEERITRNRPPVPPPVAHIEKFLYAPSPAIFQGECSGLTLCRAASYYAEAESAAAFITGLVRDQGFRFRDIAVICNDLDVRGAAIRRVFTQYGLRFFMDEKRKVLHNPVVSFLSALLDVVTDHFLYEDVFLLLKTDLSPLTQEEYEKLENYALRYRIRGKRWKKEFPYGVKEYGEESLAALNDLRERFVLWISGFEKDFSQARTVGEKTRTLLSFFNGPAELPLQIEALSASLTEEGMLEEALEIAQIWEKILGLLEQLGELMADRELTGEEYRSLLQTGLASIEMGLIPPTVDEIVIGTMSRTRVGPIKALVVLGANDGVLPAGFKEDALLNSDERSTLLGQNIEICKEDDLRIMEERLAIYKNLSRPTRYLWMSHSAADTDGKEIRPSLIFIKLQKMFPQLAVEKDILNREDPLALMENSAAAVQHLTSALWDAVDANKDPAPPWRAALVWYRQKEDRRFRLAMDGMLFCNEEEKLDASLVSRIFARDLPSASSPAQDLVLSPSRIERFSRCPFAHLVLYGLSPEELRVFEVTGREVGDIYHECLMLLAQTLHREGQEITHPASPWMTLSQPQCEALVTGFLERSAAEYREGVLLSGQEERYRAERMKDICARAAWELVRHVQQGHIKKIYFEESFGKGPGKTFPAISLSVEGTEVRIEGKIDRADILANEYVKIIDYKSGREHFNAVEAKGGWRLQLMLYLKAAMEGMAQKGGTPRPAGVFYFEIADPLIDATVLNRTQLSEKLEREIQRAFKLDGILVNEASVIQDMAGDFSGYSDILPLYRGKDGSIKGTTEKKLLSPEEFLQLQDAVDQTVKALCGKLVSGVYAAHPKKAGKETACDYCQYKSICNFELSFDGCSYDVVI